MEVVKKRSGLNKRKWGVAMAFAISWDGFFVRAGAIRYT
jgi:hypothetical protein